MIMSFWNSWLTSHLGSVTAATLKSGEVQDVIAKKLVPGFLGYGTNDEALYQQKVSQLEEEDQEAIDLLDEAMEKWEHARWREVIGKMESLQGETTTKFDPKTGKKVSETKSAPKDIGEETLRQIAKRIRTGPDDERDQRIQKVLASLRKRNIIIKDPGTQKVLRWGREAKSKASEVITDGEIPVQVRGPRYWAFVLGAVPAVALFAISPEILKWIEVVVLAIVIIAWRLNSRHGG